MNIITIIAQAEPHWTTIVAALSAAAVCIVSIAAVVVNYFFFRVHIDPHVIVYTATDDARPMVILLIIENVGKGLARDVRFHLSRSIPWHAGFRGRGATAASMSKGPLVDGIPSLGPGAKRVLPWGTYDGLKEAIGDEVVTVRCTFGRAHREPFEPLELTTESCIEVRSFDETDAVDSDGARQSAKQLKRIAKVLEKITSSAR